MSVTITERASKHVLSCLKKRGSGLGLRVGVKKAGCSGFTYFFEFADKVLNEDQVFHSNGVDLVVDSEDYSSIKDCQIDLMQSGLNQMIVVKNPNETGRCGCGESFSL